MYMTVCNIMTGHGGWPLTIIMTPTKKPFFSATYIPKESKSRLVGMVDLIPKIGEAWKTNREEILSASENITSSLMKFSRSSKGQELDESILQFAYGEFLNRFDESFGGFGDAPKFPSPHTLLFLLRLWRQTGSKKALDMVEKTLDAMRLGGIWDHVGFGFHRYSTDRYWLVPHFEKMLYDQAMLTMAFTEGYLAANKDEYKKTTNEIIKYVLRDMTSPEGAFYSAEDADSEGEEGKFYLWSEGEIRKILGNDADIILKIYNFSKEGNYTDEIAGEKTRKNIPHLKKQIKDMAEGFNLEPEELKIRIENARKILFEERKKRIHPQKDDKILTDLNGLMIAALAKAGGTFSEKKYLESAESAMEFILREMADSDHHLMHRFKGDEAVISGFLDDYAFLVWGLLELYKSTFKTKYLEHAIEFTNYINQHFWDEEGLGYFLTSNDAEELLIRQKSSYDGAIPSGNSVAMMNLLKLGRITGNSQWDDMANKIQRAFSKGISSQPTAHTMFLSGLNFGLGPTYEVVIVGDLDSEDTKKMLSIINGSFNPNMVVVHKPKYDEAEDIASLAPYTSSLELIGGKTTAYVCQNFTCNLPTNDPYEVAKQLGTQKSNK
jgi:uncharacterized protein YyaL (SSP411 family)